MAGASCCESAAPWACEAFGSAAWCDEWSVACVTGECFFFSLTGTSGIPHFGHSPGLSEITSGCIRQVYFWSAAAVDWPKALSCDNAGGVRRAVIRIKLTVTNLTVLTFSICKLLD